MKYTPEFKEFLKIAQNCDQTYVGHGNPNASILIVANEPGDVDAFRKENDFEQNRQKWEKNIASEKGIEYVEDMFNGNHLCWDKFNPLWPYKGQHFTIGKDFRHTSRTWYQYQKLVDMIYSSNNECTRRKNDTLDYFERAFITDFSAVYGKKSKDIPYGDRLNSIRKRLPLFRSAFIDHFPIIIVASGHYIRDFEPLNNLKNVFSGFSTIDFVKDDLGWTNIHYSNDRKRVLIHTYHFASAIKDEYLKKIARICNSDGRL